MTLDTRALQRLLNAAGYYSGGIDGDYGPKTRAGVEKVLARNKATALNWTEARQKIAAIQVILNAAGWSAGTVDGYSGPNTQEAYNAWDYYMTNGRREVLPERLDPTPTIPSTRWPKQADAAKFYGKAGSPACTAGKAKFPFPFRIAWNLDQKVNQFSCHEKVAASFTAIWEQTAKHYGEAKMRALGLDLFGGCYNYREVRGGTNLSTHAWGIAYDVDPERNQLRWGKDRALLAGPDYLAFWAIVEAQGALSLGRARNYDWMHFQFATL